MAVDLLQRIGLSKYEAEAYVVLLAQGPLTGYELGKRSGVPLSKSYEVLERLTRRGLALVQPGEPARYSAEGAERFLDQLRVEQSALLSALADALADAVPADPAEEFWVVRGRANVLARACASIDEARDEIGLALSPAGGADDAPDLSEALDRARARGCRVVQHPATATAGGRELIGLLIDGRRGLVGTLSPAAASQAVVSANPALALVLASLLSERPGAATDGERFASASRVAEAERAASGDDGESLDWLAWEDRKHQRLWRSLRGGRVA